MNRELEEEPDNLIYYNSIKKYLLDPKTGLQSTERIYQKLRKEALVNGFSKLSNFSNLSPSRKTIDKIRSSLKTYQVNSATRFTNENIYNTIVATRIGDMFQIDLMDVSRLSTKNNSIHFILTCIDVYSRYVIIEVIKNKTMKNVANAFESIMKKYDDKVMIGQSKGINIKNVTSDDGSEFNNKIFKALLNKHGIRQWITKAGTPNKLPIIERFHRTLRHMMNIYFDNYNTMKYTDVLDDIITNYNTSIHRTLKNTPTKIFLKEALYKQKKNVSINPFKVGDTVRKTTNKKVFDKGEKTFSHQLYVITKVNFYSFNLKNKTTGELLDRNFMGYELKKVNYNQKNYDKILSKRNLEREEVDLLATTKRRQKAEPAFNDKNTHQVDDEGNVVIIRRHLKPLNEKRVPKKIKLL